MSEDKNVSKPRQLWDSAVKAVKGGSTEQLVETFTSEMTLVAEGLCEDQNNLRKELAQVREMAEKLEQRADNHPAGKPEGHGPPTGRADAPYRRIGGKNHPQRQGRTAKEGHGHYQPADGVGRYRGRRVDYRHGAEPIQVSYRRRL